MQLPANTPRGRRSDIDPAALRDFWLVYEAHHEELAAKTLDDVRDHPQFGPMLQKTPPEVRAQQNRESRERLRRAIYDGEWEAYEENLRSQGALYAQMGITFSGWHELIRPFSRHAIPLLVRAYGAEPGRLSASLIGLQAFMDRVLELIANAYLATKEREIRKSEQHLAITLDSIGDAVIATDTRGCVVRMNPVAEQLTGYQAQEAVGRPLEEVFRIHSEETGEVVANPVAQVLREGVVLGLANHTSLTAKDGRVRPIADSAAPIRGEGGETLGVVLVFRDQSEERRAEAETRKWERLFLHAGWGVAIAAPDGTLSALNPALARLHRRSMEELQGTHIGDLLAPEERPGLARRLGELQENQHISFESRGLRPEGQTVPVQVSASVVKDPQGQVLFYALNVQDISERKRHEEIRLRLLETEAHSQRVEEANRLKSEFLANMSHELRTPLNAILGFAELIHDGEVREGMPQYQEFLGDILSSGRHLLQLINDVLDLSKVEAGKMEFRPEPTNPAQVVAEVTGILRTTAASKRIRLEAALEPSLTEVVVDPARLKQVLYNFLSNALKFTPEGGSVRVRVRPEGAERFALEVEDSGIGIAEADLGRLFTEFQQLDAGAAKKHSGTGLGLALTRKLVEAQGGAVGVESTLGQGSLFRATLPRRAFGPIRPVTAPRLPAPNLAGAPVVLVVEDEPRERLVLVQALEQAGYAVEVARSGQQALALSRERAFDAITLDLLLPDMGGLEVLGELRAGGRNQRTPVIVVTVVAEKGALAGFAVHDLLAKPLEPGRLLSSLSRAGLFPHQAEQVLVVDDDHASLKLAATILEQVGYQSICYRDAENALQALEQVRPVAVVLDLMLPGMDGFEFLERLRALPRHRQMPVIVWSVKDLTPGEAAQLRERAQAVLQKGRGNNGALLEELGALLAARRPGREA